MEYMLLIYDDESAAANRGEAESGEIYSAYMAYSKALVDAGAMRGGNALQAVATASSVRVRDGQTLTTDGPFAETKEQLGGYYHIDCADLDEALAWAAKIPSAVSGTIEVRPIMSMS